MSAHFYFVPEEEAKIEIKKKQEFMLVGGSSGSVGINWKRVSHFTNKLHISRCAKLESNWNLWSIDNCEIFIADVLTLQNGNLAIA